MIILAIDPGADSGWSLWSGVNFIGCGFGRPLFDSNGARLTVVVERPEFYEGKDPRMVDRLLTLQTDMGRRLQDAMSRFDVAAAYGVKPKTWKGSMSKDAHHAIVRESMHPNALAVAHECMARVPKSKQHNVWDGVALGQWASKRESILRTCTDYVYEPLK